MKVTVWILSAIIVFLCYQVYSQHNSINTLLEYAVVTVVSSQQIIENTTKLEEHSALLKQLMGVDYEQKEKYLFNY